MVVKYVYYFPMYVTWCVYSLSFEKWRRDIEIHNHGFSYKRYIEFEEEFYTSFKYVAGLFWKTIGLVIAVTIFL